MSESKKSKLLETLLLRKRITCGQDLDKLETELGIEYAKLAKDAGVGKPAEAAEERLHELRKRQSIQGEEYGENLKGRIRTRKTKAGENEAYVKPPSKFGIFKQRIGLGSEHTKTEYQKALDLFDKRDATTNSVKKSGYENEIRKILRKAKLTADQKKFIEDRLKPAAATAAPPPGPSPPPPSPPPLRASHHSTDDQAFCAP